MNRQPFEKPSRWWSPKLSRRWIRFWRFGRMREQIRKHRLLSIEVRGAEKVREALAQDQGVLITPNHAGHADCFSLYAAADPIASPFYVMVAWQVFQRSGWFKQQLLRQHGCFSIDREGTDMTALRTARTVLMSEKQPLVIFPEGEVYHLNDRITPFREGPAAIALLAAKKASRPIVAVPTAIQYHYVEDPTDELLELMSRLEQAALWRPRPDLTLPQRIYHLAEALIALKEIEYLGQTSSGNLPDRIAALSDFILRQIENRQQLSTDAASIPERVKAARKRVIENLSDLPDDAPEREQLLIDLHDLFVVVQSFSYPGDYVSESPSIERIAETLDKFEEDVLGAPTASIRGARRGTITFGDPIEVVAKGSGKMTAADLTRQLEQRVQQMLSER